MTSHAETKPASPLDKFCDRSEFLLTNFSVAVAHNDLNAMKDVVVMAAKDTVKIIFAGNDIRHLDFLK